MMNLNLIAYGIYGLMTVVITVFVGRSLHQKGLHFIVDIFEEKAISNAINNILLIGYYLVNIGFAVVKLSHWQRVRNFSDLIEGVSENISVLLMLLGFLNIMNIAVLSFFRKNKHHFLTNENFQS